MSKTIPGGYYLDSKGNPKDASGKPVAERKESKADAKTSAKKEG